MSTGTGPEVTVAMPARNAGRHIGAAISSVLAQDVDLELVVVDDGSTDDTAAVAGSTGDPRLRVVRNEGPRGIGYSHNRAVTYSRAQVIAHVDADDVILPGALRKLVDAVQRSPTVGQAYCHHFPLDGDDPTSPTQRAWRTRLEGQRRGPIDYRRDLVVHGMIVNHLRTYRRTVFDVVGGFDEGLRYGVDYEMALRIGERFDFALVPEFLYGKRLHDQGLTEGMRYKAARYWWSRLRLCRRQLRRNGGRMLGRSRAGCYALLGLGLLYATGLPQAASDARRALGGRA